MNKRQIANVLTVAVLLLGGYYIWVKFGSSLKSALGLGGAGITVLSNPYIGSEAAANAGVAAAEAKGDPTLNKTMGDILGIGMPPLPTLAPSGS